MLGAEPQILRHARMSHVGVDQQYGAVKLHGDADRQIDRREGFALARQRARHHDEVAVFDRVRAERIRQQRAFDHAVFFSQCAALIIAGKQAACAQAGKIYIDLARSECLGGVGRRSGGWPRARCLARRLGFDFNFGHSLLD